MNDTVNNVPNKLRDNTTKTFYYIPYDFDEDDYYNEWVYTYSKFVS